MGGDKPAAREVLKVLLQMRKLRNPKKSENVSKVQSQMNGALIWIKVARFIPVQTASFIRVVD
jgi:hypothetical protein